MTLFFFFRMLIHLICSVFYLFSAIISSQCQEMHNKGSTLKSNLSKDKILKTISYCSAKIILWTTSKTFLLHELLISHFLFPKEISCHFTAVENSRCLRTKFATKFCVEWLYSLLWIHFCFVLCLFLSWKNPTVLQLEIIIIGRFVALFCLILAFMSWHKKCFSAQKKCLLSFHDRVFSGKLGHTCDF